MKPEEKSLLLKDLCARLPYWVKVYDDMGRTYTLNIGNCYLIDLFYENGDYVDVPFKPYLRPMSSMTEEEVIEFNNIPSTKNYQIVKEDLPWDVANYKQIDWLLSHHFDFRGLISKGLAIEVTEDNNPYK